MRILGKMGQMGKRGGQALKTVRYDETGNLNISTGPLVHVERRGS